ncbi:UNVERIFIED_CONTAM: hypothetical protein FKN15_028814 [Acipenser sinensis]
MTMMRMRKGTQTAQPQRRNHQSSPTGRTGQVQVLLRRLGPLSSPCAEQRATSTRLTCLTVRHHYPQLILCCRQEVIGLDVTQGDLLTG